MWNEIFPAVSTSRLRDSRRFGWETRPIALGHRDQRAIASLLNRPDQNNHHTIARGIKKQIPIHAAL